jgi:hypothetical protein
LDTGDADDLAGAGQIGFSVDGVKHNKKIEIDLAQVHCCAPRAFLVVWNAPNHISVMNVNTRRE